ncbi:unnamed protein product [Parajaminaea phylloscopi]
MAPVAQAEPSIEALNLPPRRTVFQRLFLLVGRLQGGDASHLRGSQRGPDGFIEVQTAAQDGPHRPTFPPGQWEVNACWFKALVPLVRGPNSVRLTHRWADGQPSGASLQLEIFYDATPRPPLHLVILAAKDSPAWSPTAQGAAGRDQRMSEAPATSSATSAQSAAPTIPPVPPGELSGFFGRARNKIDRALGGISLSSTGSPDRPALVDTPPGWRRDRLLGGGLAEVKRRFALQALTWQAFHAEQMHRQGFGHRTFLLEEKDEGQISLGGQYLDLPSLPHVHVLRSEHTLHEFRDANNAQQHRGASNGGAMHAFAGEALEKEDFWRSGLPGSAIAVLVLDSMWDPASSLLRGHAAVGSHGGLAQGRLSHGVMGSHWLWACPSSLEEVTPAFLDEEPTDARHCCNDLGEGRTVSLTINIGSGAMIHEVGHAFDNPHWPSGIMSRGYIEWNRAFMTRETHSLRGGARILKPITPENDSQENHLHRCQAIRARLHPSYAFPDDPLPVYRGNRSWDEWVNLEPSLSPTAQGILCGSDAGIAKIVVEVGDSYRTHLEFGLAPNQPQPPKSYLMTPQHVAQLVHFDPLSSSSPEVKIVVTGWNLRHAELNSYRRMGLARPVAVPGVDLRAFGREVRNGPRTKVDDDANHRHQSVLLHSAWRGGPTLTAIEIFAHSALHAIVFHYSDRSTQVIGHPPRGRPQATIQLSTGESLGALEVRSGWWVDAAAARLSPSGRLSDFAGGDGGGRRTLAPACDSEEIVGVIASMGDWVDSLGVLVADKRGTGQ